MKQLFFIAAMIAVLANMVAAQFVLCIEESGSAALEQLHTSGCGSVHAHAHHEEHADDCTDLELLTEHTELRPVLLPPVAELILYNPIPHKFLEVTLADHDLRPLIAESHAPPSTFFSPETTVIRC